MIKRSPTKGAIRFRVNRDQRAYITTGKKSDKGYPQTLDHFDVSAFPEIAAVYGDKPTEIVIALPSNQIADFFDDTFGAWARKSGDATLKRNCDGVECTHRVEEALNGVQYGRGEVSECVCVDLPEDDKQRCSYTAILKAFVLHPDGREFLSPICYAFKTGSLNSGDSVRSELLKMDFLMRQQNAGENRLAGLPLRLSVRMVGGKADARQKFPIWSLTAMTFAVPTLPESTASEAPLALGSGEPIPEEPEPEQKQEEAPTKTRTLMTAEQLIVLLPKTAAKAAKTIEKNGGHYEGRDYAASRRLAFASLSAITKDDDEQRRFVQAVFGRDSRKDLTHAELETLRYWINATREEMDGAPYWVPGDFVEKEFRAVLDTVPVEEVSPLGDGFDKEGHPINDTQLFNQKGEATT